MPKYRFIEDLHNIHKGEEIWVLGCGPSLDDFPDDFFEEKNRIAIAATWSMVAFPNCAYSAFSQVNTRQLIHVLRNRSHLLHKHIVRLRLIELENKVFIGPEPIYSRMDEERELGGSDPTYLRIRGMELKSVKKRFDFSSLANDLISGTPMSFASAGTCIHSEIQAAVVMGAKKVTLAGCETRSPKFQGHAYKRGLDKIYKERDQKEVCSKNHFVKEAINRKRMRAGTAFLAKIMKPHGIQIARYYYNKGYELIDWEKLND